MVPLDWDLSAAPFSEARGVPPPGARAPMGPNGVGSEWARAGENRQSPPPACLLGRAERARGTLRPGTVCPALWGGAELPGKERLAWWWGGDERHSRGASSRGGSVAAPHQQGWEQKACRCGKLLGGGRAVVPPPALSVAGPQGSTFQPTQRRASIPLAASEPASQAQLRQLPSEAGRQALGLSGTKRWRCLLASLPPPAASFPFGFDFLPSGFAGAV